MIFIAVHHVVSASQKSGINSYYYRREGPSLMTPDGKLDVLRAQQEPGELIDVELSIKPGGNRVPAFLDLAAEDRPVIERARAFFQRAEQDLLRRRPPLLSATDSFALHFNTDLGLHPRQREELSSLVAIALRLLEHPPAHTLRDDEPLVVPVTYDEKGATFTLDEASVARLRQHKGKDWIVSPVHIAHQVLDDFERLVGGMLPQMGLILTRLDDQELLRLGGVKYVEASSGKVLAQWPSRKKR